MAWRRGLSIRLWHLFSQNFQQKEAFLGILFMDLRSLIGKHLMISWIDPNLEGSVGICPWCRGVDGNMIALSTHQQSLDNAITWYNLSCIKTIRQVNW